MQMLLGLVTRDNPLERLRERLYLRVKSVIGHNQTTWISLQQKKIETKVEVDLCLSTDFRLDCRSKPAKLIVMRSSAFRLG